MLMPLCLCCWSLGIIKDLDDGLGNIGGYRSFDRLDYQEVFIGSVSFKRHKG